jgi:hypothetical protein
MRAMEALEATLLLPTEPGVTGRYSSTSGSGSSTGSSNPIPVIDVNVALDEARNALAPVVVDED